MPTIAPSYIIPLLVEQPTWGGDYIAGAKSLQHPFVRGKKIGQSFELYSGSLLTATFPPTFAFAVAPNFFEYAIVDNTQTTYSLQSLIDQSPVDVLGQRAIDLGWTSMQVLIKFTQAKNNSYQVHVRPDKKFGKWLPKPESWYYFEEGKATLGLADVTQVAAYQQRCQEIDQFAQQLSTTIKSGKLTVADARQQLQEFIDQDHPRRFVNTIAIEKGAVIDLSQGGTHHSWELDAAQPNGNILYEVQVDVMDDLCTLRSFDQGSIKDNGSVRPLTIADYFQALDLSPEKNSPAKFLSQSTKWSDQGAEVQQLFKNQYYSTEQVTFTGEYQGKQTKTDGSFHHLYAMSGKITIEVTGQTLEFPQGWSVFLPAQTGSYRLISKDQQAQVLITHI